MITYQKEHESNHKPNNPSPILDPQFPIPNSQPPILNHPPPEQQSYFDFHYEDEDNLFEEMNEFYAFQEVEQLTENLRMWQQSDFNSGMSVRPFTTHPSHTLRAPG